MLLSPSGCSTAGKRGWGLCKTPPSPPGVQGTGALRLFQPQRRLLPGFNEEFISRALIISRRPTLSRLWERFCAPGRSPLPTGSYWEGLGPPGDPRAWQSGHSSVGGFVLKELCPLPAGWGGQGVMPTLFIWEFLVFMECLGRDLEVLGWDRRGDRDNAGGSVWELELSGRCGALGECGCRCQAQPSLSKTADFPPKPAVSPPKTTHFSPK